MSSEEPHSLWCLSNRGYFLTETTCLTDLGFHGLSSELAGTSTTTTTTTPTIYWSRTRPLARTANTQVPFWTLRSESPGCSPTGDMDTHSGLRTAALVLSLCLLLLPRISSHLFRRHLGFLPLPEGIINQPLIPRSPRLHLEQVTRHCLWEKQLTYKPVPATCSLCLGNLPSGVHF